MMLAMGSWSARAQLGAPPVTDDAPYGGKLLATGGLSELDGAGGGGLTPWAVITGYGTSTQIGANGHFTHIRADDIHIDSAGAAIGLYDRIEISVAQQRLDTQAMGAALGLGRGYAIRQDVVGVKLKLAGNAVLDQHTWLPQVAVGALYKNNSRGALVRGLGARGDAAVDVYLSATKVLLAHSLILNGTLRLTKANQGGFLGFGQSYKPVIEGSAGVLLDRHWVAGIEYRMKPDRLAGYRENDWYDAFVAWFPNKHVSVTLAYVRLGNIVIRDGQDAAYLSMQWGF